MGNSKRKKSQYRVLFVDDEGCILDLLTEVFSIEGYDTYSAVDGKEGLEWIRRKDFDIVITDCRMPCMTGVELYRNAKKLRPGIESKFVFMTSDHDLEGRQALTKETGAEVVPKPFLIKEIQDAVKKLLLETGKV